MRGAFAGIVDYAGLFPPANGTMAQAVSAYDSYHESGDRWMLGRFVVAASRLAELGTTVRSQGLEISAADPWKLSAVLGANLPEEIARIEAFHHEWRRSGLVVDSVETKVTSPGQAEAVADQIPRHFLRHFEVPARGPYGPIVAMIKRVDSFAKVRTGGTTAESIPLPEDLTSFLMSVVSRDVPFKATAGLHHPIRGDFPLTYDDNAPRATMYGFVNLLLAVAEIAKSGDSDLAREVLEESNPDAFDHGPDVITWRDRRYDEAELTAIRSRYFLSFGSCSFREPVVELSSAQAA